MPLKNQPYTFKLSLRSFGLPGTFKDSPTIDASDVKVRTDEGTLANIATLPTATGIEVLVNLSEAEMTGDNYVWVQFIDQTAPKQWADFSEFIPLEDAAIGGLTAEDIAAAVVAALPSFPSVPNTTDIAIAVRAKFHDEPLLKAETFS